MNGSATEICHRLRWGSPTAATVVGVVALLAPFATIPLAILIDRTTSSAASAVGLLLAFSARGGVCLGVIYTIELDELRAHHWESNGRPAFGLPLARFVRGTRQREWAHASRAHSVSEGVRASGPIRRVSAVPSPAAVAR